MGWLLPLIGLSMVDELPAEDEQFAPVEEAAPADEGLTEQASVEAPEPLEPGLLHATLANGLQVSILTDPLLPVVATQHWIRVGGAHETPDQRGFAHLFEHMMFAATATRPRGEYAKFHTRIGGSRNGYTTRDHTVYVSTVAPQHHRAVLEMEAERLRDLVFDPDEMAIDQKIVTEELRLRTENDATSRIYTAFRRALLGTHPYAISPVGTQEDIAAATLEDAQAFYDDYYRPDFVHLIIAGPVPGMATLETVESLYGGLEPSGAVPPEIPPLVGWEYPERIDLTEDIPPIRGTALAWALPATHHPDHWAVELMISLLTGGEIDAFEEALVGRRRALGAWTSTNRYREGGSLYFAAINLPTKRPGRAFRQMERGVEILDELEWLSQEALDAARRRKLRQEHFGRFSADSMARRIGRAQRMYGDPDLAFGAAEALQAVTTDDVARVWRTYIVQAEPTRIHARRGPGEGDP